jgi:hypothetical protein
MSGDGQPRSGVADSAETTESICRILSDVGGYCHESMIEGKVYLTLEAQHNGISGSLIEGGHDHTLLYER